MKLRENLLTVKEGASLLNISVATFWRRVADGTVPRPLKIGSLSRWRLEDIEAVICCADAGRTPSRPGQLVDAAENIKIGGAA